MLPFQLYSSRNYLPPECAVGIRSRDACQEYSSIGGWRTTGRERLDLSLPTSPRLDQCVDEATDSKHRGLSCLLGRQFFHLLTQPPYSEDVRKCHTNALARTIRIHRKQAKSNFPTAENPLDLSWQSKTGSSSRTCVAEGMQRCAVLPYPRLRALSLWTNRGPHRAAVNKDSFTDQPLRSEVWPGAESNHQQADPSLDAAMLFAPDGSLAPHALAAVRLPRRCVPVESADVSARLPVRPGEPGS
jgi:hypothetical protein